MALNKWHLDFNKESIVRNAFENLKRFYEMDKVDVRATTYKQNLEMGGLNIQKYLEYDDNFSFVMLPTKSAEKAGCPTIYIERSSTYDLSIGENIQTYTISMKNPNVLEMVTCPPSGIIKDMLDWLRTIDPGPPLGHPLSVGYKRSRTKQKKLRQTRESLERMFRGG